MEAERVKNKELLTSRREGLYQKINNMLQAVSKVLADPNTVHTTLSLRAERETLADVWA